MYTENCFSLSPGWRRRLQQACGSEPGEFLYVKVATQMLYVVRNSESVREFAVSTARNGIGSQDGSLRTPPGIHRIYRKIGGGAPPGRIFESRCDTGIDCTYDGHQNSERRQVLTRILWLQGCEPGLNRGDGIDSLSRYIYIHGTNNEEKIGTPNSHGCITMKNNEVIELFDMVEEGCIVIID
jgi:lipoprotein-anchoring transpeptidase ErfK/SrfK